MGRTSDNIYRSGLYHGSGIVSDFFIIINILPPSLQSFLVCGRFVLDTSVTRQLVYSFCVVYVSSVSGG